MVLLNRTKRTLKTFGVMGLFLTVSGVHAFAQTLGSSTTIAQPLSWFNTDNAPLAFKNEQSTASFSIPIQANTVVQSVNMQLKGWNSPALLAKASSILVSVNGTPAGIVPLDGRQPEISDVINLSGSLFNPGYNKITLKAAQTTGTTCEKFDDPALWTQIGNNSTITVVSTKNDLQPSFNQLGAIFDKHTLSSTATVTILYNDAVAKSPDVLIGAAEGIGLRYDYVPVVINARPLTPANIATAMAAPGNVVILAPDDGAETVAAPADLSLQVKTAGMLLKITGGINATAQAARLLGSGEQPWPSGNKAEITVPINDHKLPVSPQPGGEMFFRGLGYSTTTLTGPQMTFGPVNFWNGTWGARAVVSLDLTYGAGSNDGATLDVYANDTFVGSIPISDPDGGRYTDYRIAIPGNVFLPGLNVLRFKAEISRRQTTVNGCTSESPGDGIPVTLFSNSGVEITGGARLTPDNLARITSAQMVPQRMSLAQATPGTFSAAATLAAKLAQVDGTANMKADLLNTQQDLDGTILIGPSAVLPTKLLKRAGITTTLQGVTVGGLISQVVARKGPSSFETLPNWLSGPLRLNFQDILGPGQPIVSGHFVGATVAAMASSDDYITALLTAANDDDLARGVDTLVDYSHWGQLAGHAAVINPGQVALAIVPSVIRPFGLRARIGYAASQHSFLALAGFFILILAGIFSIRVALRLRHRLLGRTVPSKDGEA